MIRIENGLCRRNILLQLGLLAPRQAEQNIQIVAHHGRFGRHWRHRLQLLDFGRRLGARVLGQPHAVDLVLKLLNLVAVAFLALIAEFALNGLQLFIQIIFALRLLHLPLHAAADLLFHLEDAKLTFHEG